MKTRNSKGSIIYGAAALTMIMLVILLFILSQAQVLSSFQQHQSASESASLFVAREICKATVPTKLGQIGLIDLSPSDPRNPFVKSNGGNNKVPVIGINTALATVRLDLLIARDLKNADMIALAQRDLAEIQAAGKSLKTAITILVNQTGSDSLFERTKALYQQNTNSALGSLKSFKILLGRVSAGGTTNVPIPSKADSAAQNNSSGGLYKPYTNIPVGNDNFAFAAIGTEPRLVQNSDFVQGSGSGQFSQLPPAVVQIVAENEIINPADNSTFTGASNQSVSTAEAGGPLLTERSTVYSIGIGGGFPSTKNFSKLTVRALLDFDGWRGIKGQAGTWLRNRSETAFYPQGNGGEGQLASQDFRDPSKGSSTQNPSTALAYGIYDWLRSLRLRPDRDEVVNAINTGDMRQLGSEVRQYAGPSTKDGNPDGLDVAEANASEQTAVQDPLEKGTPAPVNLVNNFRGSLAGCAFRSGDTSEPRYNALLGTEAGGANLYADAFNYNSVDSVKDGEQSPQTSPALNADPENGSSLSTTGQSANEVDQFVQGVIATNRAAVTSRIAGRMALVEGLQAEILINGDGTRGTTGTISTPSGAFTTAFQQHKQNQKINLGSRGVLQPAAIVRELTREKCFREVFEDIRFIQPYATAPTSIDQINASTALRTAAKDLQSLINTYVTLPVIANSPINDRTKLNDFLKLNADTAQVNGIISGALGVEAVMNIETQRISSIRKRGEQCLLNGKLAYDRTNNILRRLKRFTAHGVRRLENEGSKETPAFAINILNPELPADPNKPSTRIVYIMPNNGESGNPLAVNRVANVNGPNYYNVAPVTRNQVDNFKVLIEQVRSSNSGAVFIANKDRLTSGTEIVPLKASASSLVLAPPASSGSPAAVGRQLQRFVRYSWDTAADEDRSDLGRYAMRYLKKKHVDGGDLLRTLDASIDAIDFVKPVTRESLRKDGSQARERLLPSIKFSQQGISGNQSDSDIPALERVFVLACKGNVAADSANGGKIVLVPVKPATNQSTRYPFAQTALVQGQYLYFAGNSLSEGGHARESLNTVRSVIARDLFADLQSGNQFNLQSATDWCNRFAVDLGTENNSNAPYLAGEFRLGNPFAFVDEPSPGAFDISIPSSLRSAPESISQTALGTIDVSETDNYQVIPSMSLTKRRAPVFGVSQDQLGEQPAPGRLPI